MSKAPIAWNKDVATVMVKLAKQQFEETGFATAISPNDANMLPWVDMQTAVLKKNIGTAAKRNVIDSNHGSAFYP